MERRAAMTAPNSLRAQRNPEAEMRTFTLDGKEYEVRAQRLDKAWAVAAYRDGQRVSQGYEADFVGGDPLCAQTIELIGELMIAAEDNVRRQGVSQRTLAETSNVESKGATGNSLAADEVGVAGGNRDH